jgi:hypothetical protein
MKPPVDRRRERRFQIHGGGFAVLRPYFYKQGQIIDVGKGGLAFRYVTSMEVPNESLRSNTSLDIFPPECQTLGVPITWCLREVPVKTVSDFELVRISFGSTAQRRCSVKFGELTQDQESALEDFIHHYHLDAPFLSSPPLE